MTPAHSRRAVVGVVLAAGLGLLVTMLAEGLPPWSGAAAAAPAAAPDSQRSLGALLSAQLAPTTTVPAAATLASPCRHNQRRQLVVVSIARQHAWACDGDRTVLSTPVTTGARGDKTPRGSFAVQGIIRNTTLTTSGGASYHVRYWIPFHLGIWGFHDASWQTMPFGSGRYLTGGSHGCVHLPTKAMHQLFDWIHYGTTVRIR